MILQKGYSTTALNFLRSRPYSVPGPQLKWWGRNIHQIKNIVWWHKLTTLAMSPKNLVVAKVEGGWNIDRGRKQVAVVSWVTAAADMSPILSFGEAKRPEWWSYTILLVRLHFISLYKSNEIKYQTTPFPWQMTIIFRLRLRFTFVPLLHVSIFVTTPLLQSLLTP